MESLLSNFTKGCSPFAISSQCGLRLALAARHKRDHSIAGHRRESILIHIGEVLRPEAGVTGRFHHFVHGAADQDQLTICSPGRFCDGDETPDVRCKGRDRDPTLQAADDRLQILSDGPLSMANALKQRVGAVAD